MTPKARKFNDLLDKEVERRAAEGNGDTYYEAHYLMEALAGYGREDSKIVLDGKTVKPIHSDGGPNSDMPKWLIVVEWDGSLFMADEWFSSYDLAELGVFEEAESYVEPVTKYRAVQ